MFMLPFLLVACSQAPSTTTPQVRVDNGDGTYSYMSAINARTTSSRTEGALTLELVGAAHYPWTPSSSVPAASNDDYRYDDGTFDGTADPVDGLIGGRIITADHLEWEIVDVDRDLLDTTVAAYDAMVAAEEVEGSDSVSPGNWDAEDYYDHEAGLEEEPGWFRYEAYTNYNCDGIKKHLWNDGDEDIIFISEHTDNVTAPMVAVYTDLGRCSGTLFDDDHVLTAGHCVYDHDNDEYVDIDSVLVCQYNGYSDQDCADAEMVNANPDFEDHDQMKFDWAVIRIDEDLGSSGRFLALSGASDSTIDGIAEHRMGGLPGIKKNDEEDCITTNWRIHLAIDGDLQTINTRTLRVDFTHGDGYSGGAYYYDGATPGGQHYVYRVHSGTIVDAFTNRSAKGPKVPFYRTAILGMP